MNIVLCNNLILIRTDFDTLNSKWMREFLNTHSRSMLFLQKSVLVFKNSNLQNLRDKFLYYLSMHYAKKHDFSYKFFLRAMLKYSSQPIKIELKKMQKPELVDVNLYAYNKDTLLISLNYPNSWVISYLRSQLDLYIERGTDISLVVDISDYKAKFRLERALRKRDILHYKIDYSYDNHFLSTIYSDFADFSFGNLSKTREEKLKIDFYTRLECPIGASRDSIRKSYKKLAKVYHPDMINEQDSYIIKHYTQKFQLLQEAYNALY